jgi:response regulator RpfG family c-di-GMP phosphodiesterase
MRYAVVEAAKGAKRNCSMKPVFTGSAKIRVLFVEDEFLIAEWVTESLSDQGFLVQVARNAREALRHLARTPVDVLFTDINLPGEMDGVALAPRARIFAGTAGDLCVRPGRHAE